MRASRVHLCLEDGQLQDLRLQLDEAYPEATPRGLDFRQVPARLAQAVVPGTAAALIGACTALEAACGLTLEEPLRQLRRLLLCGEWLRGHSRHIYGWHAVRLLGFPSLPAMAAHYPEAVTRARRLNRLGVALLQRVGGRCGRPTRLQVGGFSALPAPHELTALLPELEWALEAARETVRLVSRLPLPRWTRDYRLLALDTGHYLGIGSAMTVGGEPLAEVSQFLPNPPAGRLFTGPLARFGVLREDLPPLARRLAAEAGLEGGVRNPYKALTLRAVELVAAVEAALDIVRGYRPPKRQQVAQPRAGEAWGGAEAAQGTWLQSYRLDAAGRVEAASLVSPAALSRAALEQDLRDHLLGRPGWDPSALLLECRQLLGCFDAGLAGRVELADTAELAAPSAP